MGNKQLEQSPYIDPGMPLNKQAVIGSAKKSGFDRKESGISHASDNRSVASNRSLAASRMRLDPLQIDSMSERSSASKKHY